VDRAEQPEEANGPNEKAGNSDGRHEHNPRTPEYSMRRIAFFAEEVHCTEQQCD
jgi:hypothetical protein